METIMGGEILIAIASTVGAGGIGWVGMKLRRHWALPDKVDRIEDDVKYLRTRFDDVLIASIDRRD